MMNLTPNQYNFTNHKNNLCDFRTYIMFRNGLYKTCGRDKAIALLKDGWHDRTQYKPKEEVLQNGILLTELEAQGRRIDSRPTWQASKNNGPTERQHEEMCGGSNSSSQRQEPGHQQHQPNSGDESGKEPSRSSIRPGQACGQVIKKRGRPKKVT